MLKLRRSAARRVVTYTCHGESWPLGAREHLARPTARDVMPPKKRRGSGWERRPRRRAEAAGADDKDEPMEAAFVGPDDDECAAEPSKWMKILDFAKDLWKSDYKPFFAAENAEARLIVDELPQSSYRRRLKGEKAAAYDQKTAGRVRQSQATLARQANTRSWSFSLVARSLSWFNQRVPHRVWNDALAERSVASRPSCLVLLEEMRRTEPVPEWTESPHVFVNGSDQTYCWQGIKGGKLGGRGKQKAGGAQASVGARTRLSHAAFVCAERTSASGMPMAIRSEVYVNSVSCKVPYTLCDLNKREADAMRMSGPYTLPFENILPALEPRQVREKLKGFQMEYHQLLCRSPSRPRS